MIQENPGFCNNWLTAKKNFTHVIVMIEQMVKRKYSFRVMSQKTLGDVKELDYFVSEKERNVGWILIGFAVICQSYSPPHIGISKYSLTSL